MIAVIDAVRNPASFFQNAPFHAGFAPHIVTSNPTNMPSPGAIQLATAAPAEEGLLATSTRSSTNRARIRALLQRAHDAINPKANLPSLFRRLLRRQGHYNRSLLEAVTLVGKSNQVLASQLDSLTAHLHARLNARDAELRAPMDKLAATAADLQGQIARLGNHVMNLQQHADDTAADLQGQIARLGNHVMNLQQHADDVSNWRQTFGSWQQTIRADIIHVGHRTERMLNTEASQHERQIDKLREAFTGENQRLREGISVGDQRLRDASTIESQKLHDAFTAENQQLRDTFTGENKQFREMVAELQTRLAAADVDRLRGLIDELTTRLSVAQVEGLRDSLAEVKTVLSDRQAHSDQQIASTSSVVESVKQQLLRDEEHLRNLQHQVDLVSGGRAFSLAEVKTVLSDRQAQTDQQIASTSSVVESVKQQLLRDEEHLRSLQQQVDGVSGSRNFLERSVSQLEERITSDGTYLKSELAQVNSFFRTLLPIAGKQKKQSKATPVTTGDDGFDHRLDSFYVRFEDEFRGSRSEIKSRIGFYLPHLRGASAGDENRPIIDVGCGRGEWLELLNDNGLKAAGVDINVAMIAQCKERGLEATVADALQHLRSLPADSQGAVTGFHIIEHLPLEVLVEMIAETTRVLQPGGLAIFESPNCKNLLVGACNFNIDPTHRNPVYPETAQFLLRLHGLEPVELHYLTPVEGAQLKSGTPEAAVLNELLYGPQDFAVIGHKRQPV